MFATGRAWIVVQAIEGGSINMFSVPSSEAHKFIPGKAVPDSHRTYVAGQRGRIIGRYVEGNSEAALIELLIAHQALYGDRDRGTALTLSAFLNFLGHFARDLSRHGVSQVAEIAEP